MVDCPESLRTGAEMLIQLRVYLLADAFRPQKPTIPEEENRRPMFNEGQESYDEQQLRQRKSSLLQLFKAVDLKPHMKSTLMRHSASSAQVLEKMTKDRQQLSKEKEKAADQSESEEENADEVLNDTQVDMIYKKSARFLCGST